MTVDIDTLFTASSSATILRLGLELAESLGLNTTSWRDGDPEKTIFNFLSDQLATREEVIGALIGSGFLADAEGDWLTIVARDFFGVDRTAAEASEPSVTFANGGGGAYSKAIGEVIVKASSTGELFRSTEALTLASGPGTTATITFVAENAGTVGTVSANDIDTIVSTMLGVTISSSTAAAGVDAQSDSSLQSACTNSLGSVSVEGPPDAFNAVALNHDLTGETTITRSYTTEDASDGTVTVYLATATGAPSAGAVTAANDAIEIWATPCCVTPTVSAASEYSQAVTQTVDGTDIPAGTEAAVSALLLTLFAAIPIGGLISRSAITTLTHSYLVAQGATDVSVVTTVPASDGALTTGFVPVVGAVSVTEI